MLISQRIGGLNISYSVDFFRISNILLFKYIIQDINIGIIKIHYSKNFIRDSV